MSFSLDLVLADNHSLSIQGPRSRSQLLFLENFVIPVVIVCFFGFFLINISYFTNMSFSFSQDQMAV